MRALIALFVVLAVAAADSVREQLQRKLSVGIDDGQPLVISGAAVTFVADYIDRGYASHYTVLGTADGDELLFTDLPGDEVYKGEEVQWEITLQGASQASAGMPSS